MPQPTDLVHLQDGSPIIPDYNSNVDVIKDLLPTSEEKDALTALATQGAAIANADGTLADATRAINAILTRLRATGEIAT